jgi:hypothetical protein
VTTFREFGCNLPSVEQTRRQQLESYLLSRALESPEFRDRLLANPKETIENETGLRFPGTVAVFIHEEKLSELHVVLPVELVTSFDQVGKAPLWKRMFRSNRW